VIVMTSDAYYAGTEEYAGYCTACNEITRSETEPDAEGYPCPACGQRTVMGLEQAMLMEHIEISEAGR